MQVLVRVLGILLSIDSSANAAGNILDVVLGLLLPV